MKSAFLRFILGKTLVPVQSYLMKFTVNIPSAFVIKETICALLKFLGDCFRLLVSLEPCLVLLVEAPALALQRLRCQVLLICALLVVESIEQAVGVYPAVESGIVEDA